jgi:hypothetical protein
MFVMKGVDMAPDEEVVLKIRACKNATGGRSGY